jgi:hypothetical protein
VEVSEQRREAEGVGAVRVVHRAFILRQHCRGTLILDLRETWQDGIEDKARSFFRMDFNGGDAEHSGSRLPYNVINSDFAR